VPPHEYAAAPGDDSNCLAMRVRRNSKSLNALLLRIGKVIGLAWSNGEFIDEVNEGASERLELPCGQALAEALERTGCMQGQLAART
jgi:hypothetical protein